MNKIRAIEGKISKLETRRATLAGELNELEGAKTELTDRLGAAILEGGNTGKIEADIAQMTARQPGLVAAVGKADNDLGGLRSELDIERTKATGLEITGIITRVKGEMSEAGDQVMQLSDDSIRWDQELRAVSGKAHAMHLTDAKGQADYLRTLWAFEHVKSLADMLNTRQPYRIERPIDELRN